MNQLTGWAPNQRPEWEARQDRNWANFKKDNFEEHWKAMHLTLASMCQKDLEATDRSLPALERVLLSYQGELQAKAQQFMRSGWMNGEEKHLLRDAFELTLQDWERCNAEFSDARMHASVRQAIAGPEWRLSM